MTGFFKCSIPSPRQILTALILWPQATILFATLASVSVWRAMWLSTLLFLSYVLCTVLSANPRFTRALFTAIPDRQTLNNTLFLLFSLGLPLSVIGTLFYKHPVVRQLSLLTWSLFIFLPASLASRQQFGLHFDTTVTYLFLHHLALFASLHIGFAWGIPFKLTLALSLFATFVKLSRNRTVSQHASSKQAHVETNPSPLPTSRSAYSTPPSSPRKLDFNRSLNGSFNRSYNESFNESYQESFSSHALSLKSIPSTSYQSSDISCSTNSTPRRRSRRST